MSGSATSRRLNFTRRSRIKRRWIEAAIRPAEPNPLLDVAVNLEELSHLPGDAAVRLVIYRRTLLEQHSLGTVGSPLTVEGHSLAAFGDAEGVLLRIMVVSSDPDSRGRLLAVADRVRVDQPVDETISERALLPFRADDGLGHQLWALDLADDTPIVLMNARLSDWNAVARSEAFVALVYPEILRQIALWVGRSAPDDTESEGPLADWADFLRILGADPQDLPPHPDDDELEAWASGCSQRFAERFSVLDRFAKVEDS